jgi:DNA-binding PadR family transcriptional regulator
VTGRPPRRSPLALAVLVMLHESPMHPYRMQQLIRQRDKAAVINVGDRGSLYKTIDRLRRDGLIAVRETARDGYRPERATYELTELGRRTWRQWLTESLSTVRDEYPEFPAAVSLLAALEPDDALQLLETRRAAVRERLDGLDASLASSAASGLPRVVRLESEHGRAVTAAELAWLDQVIGDLRAGRLSWSFDELLEIARRWSPEEPAG